MRDRIVDALKPLGVDLFWNVNDTNSDEYIIFSIYNTANTDLCDNRHLSTEYHIVLIYWFKSLKCLNNEDKIPDLMKKSGFYFVSKQDRYESGFYGIEYTFTIEITDRDGENHG